MRRQRDVAAVVVCIAVLAPLPAAAQSTLRSISAAVQDGRAILTIESDGPLPMPEPHVLDGPPRIYFDLSGVRPKSARPNDFAGAGLVSRARIALRSVNPNVTRVVFDLTQRGNFVIDTSKRDAGRIIFFVGAGPAVPPPPIVKDPAPLDAAAKAKALATGLSSERDRRAPDPIPTPPEMTAAASAPVAPPLPAAPPAPAPIATRNPTRLPQATVKRQLPTREAEVYRVQLGGALERMAARRPLLASIDAGDTVVVETLTAALKEFRELRRILDRVEPSSVVRPTHDLLIESCTLAGVAVSLRMEAEVDHGEQRLHNAASAASGALMLFDLVCADMGCAAAPR